MTKPNFRLPAHGVPHPNDYDQRMWVNHLRWAIAVMDEDDGALPFLASCLAQAWRNGGRLSPRQEDACMAEIYRLFHAFNEGRLDCQRPPQSPPVYTPEDEQ